MDKNSTRFLMVQGTASDAGKSLFVAGLARAATNKGLRVRPFKPQNMSNNAAVVEMGIGEIGRAQQLQAKACRVPSVVHMNPILLKPQGQQQSQLIVHGVYKRNVHAKDFRHFKKELLDYALESFEILKAEADLVLIEGAGSASEINLRSGDIANMGFAEAVDAPVLLLGDIHKGGVIAAICGTHLLLSEAEKKYVKGYVINKFRGDPSLFDPALTEISNITSWQSLGVVPWFDKAAYLPQEDTLSLHLYDNRKQNESKTLSIAIPHCPYISNFDDLDPLRLDPNISLHLIEPHKAIPSSADVVLLPGSKNTIADLKYIREKGWDIDILAHARQKKPIMGICGGFQMLGSMIFDPEKREGQETEMKGLGILDCTTILGGNKQLIHKKGLCSFTGTNVEGYEMHIGSTSKPRQSQAFATFDDSTDDGIVKENMIGTYLHGIFANDDFRKALIGSWSDKTTHEALAYEKLIDETLDELSEHIAKHTSLEDILKLATQR